MKLFKQTGRLTTSSAMVLILLPAMTMLSACGNSGGILPTSSLSEIAQLNRRLDDLTRQLEAARAEAAEANSLAEGALATAEVAQSMAAASDDKVERMFERAVFK